MNARRAVVVDCGLSLAGGHHSSHLKGVIFELRQKGYEVQIVSSRMLREGSFDNTPIVRCLTVTGYEKEDDGQINETPYSGYAKRLAADLLAVDAVLTDAETLLFLNTTPIVLAAIAYWLQLRISPPRAEIFIYLLADFGVRLIRRLGKQFFLETEAARFITCQMAVTYLCEHRPSITFLASSEVKALEVAALGISNIELYDISHTIDSFVDGAQVLSGYICLYAGDAKYEKGITDLSTICSLLFAAIPQSELAIHINDVAGNFCSSVQSLRELSHANSKLTLVEGKLNDWLFFQFLSGAELVVLPYRTSKYGTAESGIWDEAILLGKPILCPKNTYVAEQMRILGGERYVFADFEQLARLAEFCLDNKEAAVRDFKAIRQRYLARSQTGTALGYRLSRMQ